MTTKRDEYSSHIKTPKQRRANKQIVHTGMWHRYQRREHLPEISYILFFWQCQVSVWSGHRALCVHHENDSAWNFLLPLRMQLQLLQKCYYPYKNTAAQLYKCMDGRTDRQIYIWNVLLYFASARFLSFWFWYHRWCCWCWYCNGSWLLLLAMVLSHYRMLFLLL